MPIPGTPGPRPALLVIDVQKAFAPFMCEQDLRLAPEGINDAMERFRRRGLPVIRVYHTDPAWGPAEDGPGFPFLDGLKVLEGDPAITKHHPSAFKGTTLAALLAEARVDTLFLCGLSATGCVLATYQGADDLDFRVFLVKGALLSPKAHHTEAVQDFCRTVDLAALDLILDGAAD